MRCHRNGLRSAHHHLGRLSFLDLVGDDNQLLLEFDHTLRLVVVQVDAQPWSTSLRLVVNAVVAGGTLGGVLGALVTVPLAASAVIIVRKVVIPRQNLH